MFTGTSRCSMNYRYDKVCEYCKRNFKAARRDARFDRPGCRANHARRARRHATIAALGARCGTCGATEVPFRIENGKGFSTTLFVHHDEDGDPYLKCGACRRRDNYYAKHGRGPYKLREWLREYLDNLPDDERESEQARMCVP